MLPTIIAGAVVVLMVGGAIASIVRDKKRGRSCCGGDCASCKCCHGGCSAPSDHHSASPADAGK